MPPPFCICNGLDNVTGYGVVSDYAIAYRSTCVFSMQIYVLQYKVCTLLGGHNSTSFESELACNLFLFSMVYRFQKHKFQLNFMIESKCSKMKIPSRMNKGDVRTWKEVI